MSAAARQRGFFVCARKADGRSLPKLDARLQAENGHIVVAAYHAHRELVERLVGKDAHVNARNLSQRTPLHFLATYMDDPELAERMILQGADVNAEDKDGNTPLAHAITADSKRVAKILRRYAEPYTGA